MAYREHADPASIIPLHPVRWTVRKCYDAASVLVTLIHTTTFVCLFASHHTWHRLQRVVRRRVRLEDVQQISAVLLEARNPAWREAAVHVAAKRLHVALVEGRPKLRTPAEQSAETMQVLSSAPTPSIGYFSGTHTHPCLTSSRTQAGSQ